MIEGVNGQENAQPAQNNQRIVYTRDMLLTFRNHPLAQIPLPQPVVLIDNDQYDPKSPALGG